MPIRLIALVSFLLLIIGIGGGCSHTQVLVSRVIDGDTIVLGSGETVRVAGIDAPELGTPAGLRIRLIVADLLEGRKLTIINRTCPITGTDRGIYGRLIADFHLPRYDMTFSEYMLINGYAVRFE